MRIRGLICYPAQVDDGGAAHATSRQEGSKVRVGCHQDMPVFVSPVEDDLISSIEHTDVADMHGFVPNG